MRPMHVQILSLIAALLIAALGVNAYAAGALVFHEVYPDDGATNRQHEYLEIVNRSEDAVLLAGWALTTKASPQDAGSLAPLPSMAALRPGQSFVIAFHEGALQTLAPTLQIDAHLAGGSGVSYYLQEGSHSSWGSGAALALPPPEQRLQLIAPDGSVSDAIAWGSAPPIAGDKLPARSDNTLAWRRAQLGVDHDPLAAWTFTPRHVLMTPDWHCGAALCGNGFLEAGEECDDGNTNNGDGCSSTCTLEEDAYCIHSELPCGGVTPRPTHCYFPAEVCEQAIALQAVYIPTDDAAGHMCQEWIEFRNDSAQDFPLHALRLTEDIQAGHGTFAGWDAFAPNHWLSPNERALVLERLTPLGHLHDRHPVESCPVGPNTGFERYFSTPPGQWFARWAIGVNNNSARWDDYVERRGIQLHDQREQVSAFCQHNKQSFDTFAFAKDGVANGALPPGWEGDRARWYPELLQYNVLNHVVFRRFPEDQDTDTKADWHLSRCPDPGVSAAGREAPIQGAAVTRQLAADGATVRVTLSEEARQRADAQIWVVPPHDPRIEVLASEGSVLFRGITSPEIFEFEWFALTTCWVSEKYTARVQFGDAVRCYPDADGDGAGDANAAGVVVGGACAPGFVENADDCDDTDASVHPGAQELCDGIDNDCDPETPDGYNETWYEQACDGDDLDLCEDGRMICIFAGPYCLETGPPKLDYCDGIDNDCNPATPDGAHDPRVNQPCDGDDPDLCLDGLTVCAGGAIACEETTPPGRVELCDGIDNDCNPATPDGYDEPLFGQRCHVGVGACAQTATYVCRDAAMTCPATPRPPAASDDTCDGIDNDCNGFVDDGVPETPIRCGVGACEAIGVERCEDGRFISECVALPPTPESYETGNCNDGIDNDCDGLTDDEDPDCQPLRSCYYDADGDGHPGTEVLLRTPDCDGEWEGHELWEISFDCNDNPADPCAIYAWNGAAEVCDGCDNDCNGLVDETFPTLGKACGDTADHCSDRRWECNPEGDALLCGENRVSADAFPPEALCNDGLDNDCDGLIDDEDPDCYPEAFVTGGRVFSCASTSLSTSGLMAWLLAGLLWVRRRHSASAV